MEKKVRFILEQAQASPPLLVAGDFFHQPRSGPFLEQWIISLLREYGVVPIVVPGQHDLPGHSLEQVPDSSLGVLAAAEVIDLLNGSGARYIGPELYIWPVPYGQEPDKKALNNVDGLRILLWHHMVVAADDLWPGQGADKAHSILKKYPQFQIIVTGDNHQTFAIAETSKCPIPTDYSLANNGKVIGERAPHWLINPGSMMRLTVAQVDHRPCVFKWEAGKLEQIFLPIEQDVWDLSELEEAKAKDSRVSAFVEGLDAQWEAGLSFEKSLEEFMDQNRTEAEVREMVWKCLE